MRAMTEARGLFTEQQMTKVHKVTSIPGLTRQNTCASTGRAPRNDVRAIDDRLHGELHDNELDAVSGGIIAILIGFSTSSAFKVP